MKAFAYLRVSGINQVEGDGFERQHLAIFKWAIKNGIAVAEVFEEKGVSGKNELADRPALQALLAALEANPDVKTILIERLDRLARDLMVQETIIADLQKSGYTLISVLEPDLCHDDPSRKLMRQIFGAISEYDRAMIVLKLRGARQRMKARGLRVEGQKPYGFYPGEKFALDLMQRHHGLGNSIKAITNTLNSLGYKSRSGREWSAPVVAKILRRSRSDSQKLELTPASSQPSGSLGLLP